MSGRLKAGLIFVLMLLLSTQVVSPVWADQGFNVEISPLPLDLVTKPGVPISTDLRVRNKNSDTEKLQLRILNVSQDSEGRVHLSPASPSDQITKWVKFSQNTFDAPSNEWVDIKMTISPPKTAAFGYYFAVEYMRANAEQQQPGRAVTEGAVANFVLLDVDAPGAKRSAEIASFTAGQNVYEFLPADFTVKIHNTGNVHVSPTGNVFILKGKQQVASLDINKEQGNVLPGAGRYYDASWSDGFPHYEYVIVNGKQQTDKRGNPVRKLKWDLSQLTHLRFGQYTANLQMVYDDGTRDIPLQAQVKFWVIPWRILGGLVLIVLILGAGLWFMGKGIMGSIRGGRRNRR